MSNRWRKAHPARMRLAERSGGNARPVPLRRDCEYPPVPALEFAVSRFPANFVPAGPPDTLPTPIGRIHRRKNPGHICRGGIRLSHRMPPRGLDLHIAASVHHWLRVRIAWERSGPARPTRPWNQPFDGNIVTHLWIVLSG